MTCRQTFLEADATQSTGEVVTVWEWNQDQIDPETILICPIQRVSHLLSEFKPLNPGKNKPCILESAVSS